MKLSTVTKKISTQSLGWTAGETSRSSSTAKELATGSAGSNVDPAMMALTQQMFGISNTLQTMIDTAAGMQTPERFSWLENHDIVSSPKDQSLTCNSCVAFAVVAAIEARMNFQTGQTSGDVNLSEGYVFFEGCGDCCKNGWITPSAISFCINDGVPSEDSFPYSPSSVSHPGHIDPVVKLLRGGKIANDPEIRRVLSTKGPVIADMDLFEDFAHYTGGIYTPSANSKRLGTHATCIVGFDDKPGNSEKPYWLCKNSWGTDWGFDPRSSTQGKGGFFKIAQGVAGIASAYFVYDIDVEILLPLAKAKEAIEKIRDKAQMSTSFRNCLKSVLKPTFPPKRCSSPEEKEIATLAKDILSVHSSLRPLLDAVLS